MAQTDEKPINNFWGYLIVSLLLGLLILAAVDTPIPSEEYTATLVGIHQAQSETPRPALLVAELPSGLNVKLAGSATILRKMGAKVIVQKYERKILPFVTYRFVRFVEEPLSH
jgi:hypothetical protein